MVSRIPTHRVVCADHRHETFSLHQAEHHRTGVERLRLCQLLHTIEVRVNDQWVPQHLVQAQDMLAAPIGAVLDTPDGPLVKTSGGWSKETTDRANVIADTTTEPEAWQTALGPHEHAELTTDGRSAHLDTWCTCPNPSPLEAWIRYEHWTTTGRAGHGYLCPTCRMITQTG